MALAAFAGAAVAGANMWKVGFTAVKIGIAGYIVPYMFVYGRALLMMGSWEKVLQATITACIGTVCLAGGFRDGLETVALAAAGHPPGCSLRFDRPTTCDRRPAQWLSPQC